jgi:hypothetical protein
MRLCAKQTQASLPLLHSPLSSTVTHPQKGHLFSLTSNTTTAFRNLEQAMRAADARMMGVSVLGRRETVILRHPDDCAAVSRDQETYGKANTGWRHLERWLGRGLVAESDVAHHAAVKEVLLPAFKAASVKGFVPLFAEVRQVKGAARLQPQGPAGGVWRPSGAGARAGARGRNAALTLWPQRPSRVCVLSKAGAEAAPLGATALRDGRPEPGTGNLGGCKYPIKLPMSNRWEKSLQT